MIVVQITYSSVTTQIRNELCRPHVYITLIRKYKSEEFLLCDAMLAWYMLWPSGSVSLSVASWCSTKTAKHIRITQTTPHNCPGTLVF